MDRSQGTSMNTSSPIPQRGRERLLAAALTLLSTTAAAQPADLTVLFKRLAPSVVVRSSPSESGTELFILHEGTKVEISEEVSGWQNIRVIDGREGWILEEELEAI